MFQTKFTEKFGVKYPIMQGAMGYYVGGPELEHHTVQADVDRPV